MHKYRPELFFVNILVAINKIMRNTKDLTYDQFVSDEKVFGLAIRELQEIGESARKILDMGAIKNESDIEWKKIIAFRNFVVHKYFGIEPTIVFEVIGKEIPSLEKKVLNVAKQNADKKYLLQAISDTKKVLSKLNRGESVAYLDKIKHLVE